MRFAVPTLRIVLSIRSIRKLFYRSFSSKYVLLGTSIISYGVDNQDRLSAFCPSSRYIRHTSAKAAIVL